MAENGETPAVEADASPAPPAPANGGEGDAGAAKSPEATDTEAGPGAATKNAVFKAQFKAFCKFGDPKSDGKLITLSQSDKWMKQAKVIGKTITTTDTGIYFKKFKSLKINIEDYNRFLEDLARNKKANITEVKSKLSSCGAPGLTGVHPTSTKAQSTVERLTDPSRYTGAHKQRFDETGRGRGIAGRKDVADTSGYVHGYQNKDTYSKSH